MDKLSMVLIAITLGTSVCFAEQVTSSEQTYKTISIHEKNITPESLMGSITFEKSVGGLVCQKQSAVVPNAVPSYACTLAFDNRDDQAIYTALNISELNVTPKGLLGSVTMQKKIANLICQKRNAVVPNAQSTYSCALQ